MRSGSIGITSEESLVSLGREGMGQRAANAVARCGPMWSGALQCPVQCPTRTDQSAREGKRLRLRVFDGADNITAEADASLFVKYLRLEIGIQRLLRCSLCNGWFRSAW